MIVAVVIRLAAELARAFYRSFLRFIRSLDRAMTARAIYRELNALPDSLLRDMGVTRSNIGYVARSIAREETGNRSRR
jgi:uncharacterized protein YjiS (DUF1127 family)